MKQINSAIVPEQRLSRSSRVQCSPRPNSPLFDTGANSLVAFALAIATPIAILIVIGAAIAATVRRIGWGWGAGAIVGTASIVGSPQIVAWIRRMYGGVGPLA